MDDWLPVSILYVVGGSIYANVMMQLDEISVALNDLALSACRDDLIVPSLIRGRLSVLILIVMLWLPFGLWGVWVSLNRQ
ncbi:MAG: hypothetical protein KAJ19_13000 [Gammaproteobacteria bacterium]|nr:hypothetical protein [Gammaproteobacteria bacterium]